ncbi:hypothetical protein ASF06_06690 [Agreia sp. Leaf244]|nr:hypothetical protein ASE64_07745 [Agreia sp. Leaf210]KQO09928.1 hypothetical protein ASF06_06690 [Agreia sp. Leaf244]
MKLRRRVVGAVDTCVIGAGFDAYDDQTCRLVRSARFALHTRASVMFRLGHSTLRHQCPHGHDHLLLWMGLIPCRHERNSARELVTQLLSSLTLGESVCS